MTAQQIMTATFQLGNSSSMRKRVTLILGDGDFSDLTACTFYIPAGQPLSDSWSRSYATQAWANAMFSLYAATVGPEQWIRLDNATLARTPGAAIQGTEVWSLAARQQWFRPTAESPAWSCRIGHATVGRHGRSPTAPERGGVVLKVAHQTSNDARHPGTTHRIAD